VVSFVLIRGPDYRRVLAELSRFNARYVTVGLSQIDEEEVVKEIRALPPQVRGRIRYGKGKPLPLTRSGRLNVKNTCILLVYEKERLVDVYPKMLGKRYVDPIEGVRIALQKAPQYYLYEEPLLILVAHHPDLLGCTRVRSVKETVELPEGVRAEMDLVLEEGDGSVVLVEVEEKATMNAIAQALSLAQAYQDYTGQEVRRVVVVALSAEESAKRAAKKAGVEIWLLKMERQ